MRGGFVTRVLGWASALGLSLFVALTATSGSALPAQTTRSPTTLVLTATPTANCGTWILAATVVPPPPPPPPTTTTVPPTTFPPSPAASPRPATDVLPTGTVTFTIVAAKQTVALPRGNATASTTFNGVFVSVTATASYSGDSNFSPSEASVPITVTCPTATTGPTTPTTLTTVPPPPTLGTTTSTTKAVLRPRTTPTTTTLPTTTRVATTTTSTTVVPTTTAPTVAPPPPAPPRGPPTLVAVDLAGKPSGPPGVGLNVSGVDYPASCRTVYVFFDRARLGSVATGGSGTVSIGKLSVPGDAAPGAHRVTSSCDSSGTPVQRRAVFTVVSRGIHRSSFVTSINQPRQLSLTAKSLGLSALVTVGLFVLLGFPSQLFNSTLQENYEEVRGWFHLRRPLSEVVQGANQRVLFPLFLAAGGVLYALLTPEFGFNLSTLALSLGLAVAVGVTTVGFALPAVAYFGLQFRDRGKILVMPGTVLLGAAMVVVSRLAHLQPGYLYGLLAVVVFHRDLDRRTTGWLAAVSAVVVMVLALVAWVARVPLTGASLQPGVGFWTVVAESALAGTFVIGLESTVVGLLPMRFLDGSRIREWNRTAWIALFAFAVFIVVEVLFQPGSGYVGHTSTPAVVSVVVLYLLFALGTVAFWGYFRARSARSPARADKDDLQIEGDFDVR